MNGLIGLFRQQVAGHLGCCVVCHQLVEPLLVEVLIVEQGLQGIAGRFGDTVTRVGNDQFDMAARIERRFDVRLPVREVLVEPGELLANQQTDALTERQCVFLLELFGCLQLGLQQVKGFRILVVVDGVDALVVEVIHDRCSGLLRCDVEQLVQNEGAEGTRELLGLLLRRRFGGVQKRRQGGHEALRQNRLQGGHVLWFKSRHVSGTSVAVLECGLRPSKMVTTASFSPVFSMAPDS